MTAVDTSVSCVFHDPTTSEIYTLSLHDALPIFPDQVTTGFPVVAGYRAFAGVVVEAAFAGSGVQAEDGIGGQGAKTHGGNVEHAGAVGLVAVRSEERRVGKECRSRWGPFHEKIGGRVHSVRII